MVQFVVRITSSLVLLGAAIYIHQYLPSTEFNNRLTVALLLFFVADGPIYGIQRSSDRIDDDDARTTVVILSIVAQSAVVLFGIVFLALGCKSIF